jgi:sigma-B regulation protein RsbU (phosphoserine phosphatase)
MQVLSFLIEQHCCILNSQKPMPEKPLQPDAPNIASHELEGDYRPASPASIKSEKILSHVDPIELSFLMRLADALNTTLDLQTLLSRTADLVRAVINYRIFAILLINDRTQNLHMRFQIGHSPDVERLKIPLGKGVVGEVAKNREPLLLNDVSESPNYINANPDVRSEMAVPLIVRNRIIGVIDIQSEEKNYFKPEHLHLLTLTASRIGQAIENARLYTRASRQAQTLAVLNEISREISSILELDELLAKIGQLLRRLIDYQMFTIMLLNEPEDALDIRYSQRYGQEAPVRQSLPLDKGIVGASISERKAINVPDVRKDPRYVMVNPETRSELVVPLLHKGRILGVLDLEHTRANFFNEDHERTLSTLASQISIAIENARLYQRVAAQEQRMESDLTMARKVQLRLMPSHPPEFVNAEIAARFFPARTIGGDLYDFLYYSPQKSAIVLGDVSGKAAPAALFAALVSGVLRAASSFELSPASMLEHLNESLQERKLESQYVAMLFGLWNDEERTLQVANAGAVQPMICRAGVVETVFAEGFPLGLFPNATYEEFTVSFQPGDSILFFSDGICDAQNPRNEMYGTDRIAKFFTANSQLPAAEFAEALLANVYEFQEGRKQFDDKTLVVLRVR